MCVKCDLGHPEACDDRALEAGARPILPGLPGGPPWPPAPGGLDPAELFARHREVTNPLRGALAVDDPFERDFTPRSAYDGEDPSDQKQP